MSGPAQLIDDLWFFKSLRQLIAESGEKLTDPHAQNPWVYRCVTSHWQNISALPLLLKRGDRKSSTIVEQHDLVTLLSKPNPMMDVHDLVTGIIISLDLAGEAFLVKESRAEKRVRPGQLPKELWLVPPSMMKEVVDKSGRLIGWSYKPPQSATPIPYMAHEVVHLRFLDPKNPYRGLAPLDAAMMEAEIDHAAAVFNKAFFENGAEIGSVLTTDQNLTKKQRDRELAHFEQRHHGPGNRGRSTLLAKGLKLDRNTATHKDMDYQEGRKWSRSVILAVFNVPPTEVGIYDDVSRDKATVARKLYWENTLVPLSKFVVKAFDALIAGTSGLESYFFEFDYSGVDALKQGEKERAEVAAIYFKEMGVPLAVLNERFDLNLPIEKIPHANQSFLPVSLVPVEMLGAEEEEGDADDDEPRHLTEGEVRQVGDDELAARAAKDAKLWKVLEKKVFGPGEKAWQSKVRSWFFAIRKEVLKKFDALAKDAPDGVQRALTESEAEILVAGRKKWADELEKRARPLYDMVVKSTTKQLADELELTAFLGPEDPAVLEFVTSRVPKLANDVTRTLAKQVRTQVLQGLAENETPDQLRRRLTKTFNVASSRALTIARTETAHAVNGTRFAAFEAEGIEKHRWVTAGDEHVRDSHAKVNGEVVPVGEFFSNGLRHPNDFENDPDGSNTINCRCLAVAA